jgi:hypothetical protein
MASTVPAIELPARIQEMAMHVQSRKQQIAVPGKLPVDLIVFVVGKTIVEP